MGLDLSDYEQKAAEAVKTFWRTRDDAAKKQVSDGKSDQGERSGVTSGKNMDGFVGLLKDLIKSNGLPDASIFLRRGVLTLPGFFRPTKLWDILVVCEGRLVAAIELKSHVGPSFGNNFNNRCEEAIGTAHDFWASFREGAFGQSSKPFAGWLILVEDAPKSRSAIADSQPHFNVMPEYQGTSYLRRYDLLCQKLVREKLYDSACLITTPRQSMDDGGYQCLSDLSSLKAFVSSLAGHIAAEAAR